MSYEFECGHLSPRSLVKNKHKNPQPGVQEGDCWPCVKNRAENSLMHLHKEFQDLYRFTHEETGLNLNQLYQDRVRRGLGDFTRPDLDDAIDALEVPVANFRNECRAQINATKQTLAKDWGDDIIYGEMVIIIMKWRSSTEDDPGKRARKTIRQGRPYPLPMILG